MKAIFSPICFRVLDCRGKRGETETCPQSFPQILGKTVSTDPVTGTASYLRLPALPPAGAPADVRAGSRRRFGARQVERCVSPSMQTRAGKGGELVHRQHLRPRPGVETRGVDRRLAAEAAERVA